MSRIVILPGDGIGPEVAREAVLCLALVSERCDLDLLFEALCGMFEHDRSAARGEMATRRLVVFRHAGALGNAPAQDLFARVRVWRQHKGARHAIGDERTDNWPVARGFGDYAITVDRDGLPQGIEVIERC